MEKGKERMNEKTHLDLFSGIGGFALAAKWNGYRTVGFCDNEPYAQSVLNLSLAIVPFRPARIGHTVIVLLTNCCNARDTAFTNPKHPSISILMGFAKVFAWMA